MPSARSRPRSEDVLPYRAVPSLLSVPELAFYRVLKTILSDKH